MTLVLTLYAFSISLATSWSFSNVLLMSTTLSPRAANSSAYALPMPSDAPVTTAHSPIFRKSTVKPSQRARKQV
uniref:Putative secreted protein n=1 Tax=Ixodes ricinus TaxID=34613 RepID=A0A6B0U1E7_IXORI